MAFVVVCVLGPIAVLGCLLVEPPADLPTLPAFRPSIRHAEVSPPQGHVLNAFPNRFLVPVDLVDPQLTIEWRAYVDFEPVRGEGLVARGTSGPDQNEATGGRLLSIVVLPSADLTRCHVVEILVANRFVGNITGITAHLPEPPGGDSVTWIVSPGGDLAGCPTYDAGAGYDATFSDAGADL